MRIIAKSKLKSVVSELLIKANTHLRDDVLKAIKVALKNEKDKRSKYILNSIIENAKIAKKESLPICQDTGMPVVFVEIGNNVRIKGGVLEDIINEALKEATRKGFLRESVVEPIINRRYASSRMGVIHEKMVKGHRLKITILPKGFGSENKTLLKMFKPTASLSFIEDFVIEAVEKAGPSACPPFVVGIGIGGTSDRACLLAKEALLRRVSANNKKSNPQVQRIKKRLLDRINKLNIGPMGLGGTTTCLGVNILTNPTHIAGLPVCVNISCHATRSASITL